MAAAQPINPLSRPASSILGFGGNPAEELQSELAERRRKALEAARLGGNSPSDLLMGRAAVAAPAS